MIYSLTGRVSLSYLREADEIIMPYDDIERVAALLKVREGNVRVVIDLSDRSYINWDMVKEYYDLCEGKCQVIIDTAERINICKDKGIDKYFMSFAYRDFYILRNYLELGVCAIRIAPPLTHSLDKLAKIAAPYNVEIRVTPNATGLEDTKASIYGGWYRPEDMDNELIQQTIDVCEFYAPRNGQQEGAIYRIYKEDKTWPGNIVYIMPGLSVYPDMINQAVLPEAIEKRLVCEQRCQKGERCNYCHTISQLADDNWLQKLKEKSNTR